jgi:hypothetical protein
MTGIVTQNSHMCLAFGGENDECVLKQSHPVCKTRGKRGRNKSSCAMRKCLRVYFLSMLSLSPSSMPAFRLFHDPNLTKEEEEVIGREIGLNPRTSCRTPAPAVAVVGIKRLLLLNDGCNKAEACDAWKERKREREGR